MTHPGELVCHTAGSGGRAYATGNGRTESHHVGELIRARSGHLDITGRTHGL